MIITRSPLRITLGGGGTDLPSYYRKYGGFVISAAINKYVYVTIVRSLVRGIFLKYFDLEHVERIDEIQHPIIRESIRMLDFKATQMEITSFADLPPGTGLGSSSSFTTALLKALFHYQRRPIPPDDLAPLACEIEINRLQQSIGKQDQYIASYGGIMCFQFHTDETIEIMPLNISTETILDLQENLLLFFTGFSRAAVTILKEQNTLTQQRDQGMLQNLHYVKELGMRSFQALEAGKTILFGELMHEHWENKKLHSEGISSPQIDEWYELGRANGAVGGKLVGAGGGGFLMFYAYDRKRLRQAMAEVGLEEVRFGFDLEGTKVLSS